MGELETRVRVYRVVYVCDTCNKGRMYKIGKHHVCSKCGARKIFDVDYPYIAYKPYADADNIVGQDNNDITTEDSDPIILEDDGIVDII